MTGISGQIRLGKVRHTYYGTTNQLRTIKFLSGLITKYRTASGIIRPQSDFNFSFQFRRFKKKTKIIKIFTDFDPLKINDFAIKIEKSK